MIITSSLKSFLMIGISATAILAPISVSAQNIEQSNSAIATDESDIVVTALRRDTRIQETPISISAISGESLANSGVQSIANLSSTVPGLNIVDGGPASRRISIRGIQASGEPTVGIYYDEVPVSGSVGGGNDAGRNTPEIRLFDVERVEVLRGPQGTLYGSSSMGGTLRIIYNKPTFETEGGADATLSATEDGGVNYEVNAVVNTPIVMDKVALRAVGFYRRNNGYIDNVQLNLKNVNDEKDYGGRLMLRLTPVERLTIDLATYYNKSNTDTPVWIKEAGRYNSNNPAGLPVRDRISLSSATANYDFGDVTATAVLSYMDRKLLITQDASRFLAAQGTSDRYDALCGGANAGRCTDPNFVQPGAPGVPPGGIVNLQQFLDFVAAQSTNNVFSDSRTKQMNGEFRLSSNGAGDINWTAGLFYSRRQTDNASGVANTDPVTGRIIQPRQLDTIRFVDDLLKQYAAFADASWNITPELNVAGGVRFFKYTKDVIGETTIPSILSGARRTPPTGAGFRETGQVFRGNISYKITPDIMLYAQAAQGFRPGGVNNVIGLPDALAPYEADKLWNYEAGVKTSLFNRMVTFNFNGFWIDWDNIQITARSANNAFSFITNAGAARVKGLEMDMTIRPAKGLSIQGSASYINAELSENQANAVIAAPGLKGDRIPFVPKFTAGVGAQYVTPISDALNMFYRADYTHTGNSYSDFRPNATFTRKVDAYNLVNIRVGLETPESNWGAYLFITNLFNDTAITRATSSAVDFGQTLVTSARPRTIGLNLRGSF